MIDLRTNANRYEIGWVDGTILHINAPKQGDFEKLSKTVEKMNSGDLSTINLAYDIAKDILVGNIEGVKITDEEMGLFDLTTIISIIFDYYSYFVDAINKYQIPSSSK